MIYYQLTQRNGGTSMYSRQSPEDVCEECGAMLWFGACSMGCDENELDEMYLDEERINYND